MNMQNLLNSLIGQIATIKNVSMGWAMLLHFQDTDYLYEIGRGYGDVFSANMVERINITESGIEIILKGEK